MPRLGAVESYVIHASLSFPHPVSHHIPFTLSLITSPATTSHSFCLWSPLPRAVIFPILPPTTVSTAVSWYQDYRSFSASRFSHSIHPADYSQKMVPWTLLSSDPPLAGNEWGKPTLPCSLLKTWTDWATSTITLLPTKLQLTSIQLRVLSSSHKPTLIIPSTEPSFTRNDLSFSLPIRPPSNPVLFVQRCLPLRLLQPPVSSLL